MKKMQTFISAFLALALLLILHPAVQAAEEDALKLYMTASAESVLMGDTVSLTLRADRGFASRGSGMTVFYDPAVLEPDISGSASAAPFTVNGPVEVGGRTGLRFSFIPGLDVSEFSQDAPLAVLKFKALAAGQTSISMGSAYLYDESLGEIPVTLPNVISLTVEKLVPVSGIRLNLTEVELEEGQMTELTATVLPEDASNRTVTWVSSDESVVKVTDGVLRAMGSGTATVTAATAEGGFTASCNVTVTPPFVGYTVAMPADTRSAVGENVQIPITVSNADGKTGYNAFHIDITYDPEILELVTDTLPEMTLTAGDGQVKILGYGEDRNAGSVPFTLEFKPLKAENTEVRITSARVDNSGNAIVQNASFAKLTDDRTAVYLNGYPVSLPDGFTGDPVAQPGENYTFSRPADYYDYIVVATVDGKQINLTDNGDGSYTIPAELVNGTIVITASKTGKIYKVTLGTDMTGEAAAQHGKSYTAVLNREDGFQYSLSVTVGGKAYTGYQVSGDTYTVPGGDIVGDIVFAVSKTSTETPPQPGKTYTVAFSGSGAGAAQGNETTITHGGTYTLTLNREAGYTYQVSYRMSGGSTQKLEAGEDGTYTVVNVSGDLEFIIEKSLDVQVEVSEYVNLDEKTVFLVLVSTDPGAGKVFTWDGNPMAYSESYGAWAYLVITRDSFQTETARQRIGLQAGEKQSLAKPDGDVNLTGLVDVNDAQLIYDIYNGRYANFEDISMVKFLNADVNGDKKLSVRDAAAVVAKIE